MKWIVLTIEQDEVAASVTQGYLQSSEIDTIIRPSTTADVIQRRMIANAGAWDVLVREEQLNEARSVLAERPPLYRVQPIDRTGGWMHYFQWIALAFVLLAVLIATFFN